ncbi:MAG: hypothetical protein C3F07_04700 [Anaerolineales bacterium]|nr:hypothetical protein [Anaerolineae bacterium]PWB75638.1 MAG: hypothetical protein C3F07_04700 [Anaerolineales bacterium]
MLERPIILQHLRPVASTDILIVLIIAGIAYFLAFNNFEKHLPLKGRVVKLFAVVGVLAGIGILFGRFAFWGFIILMTLGQIYLHGWCFPKQGINGLTAEPYDKYLKVIEQMKGIKK